MQFGYVVTSAVGSMVTLGAAEWTGTTNNVANIGENNLLFPEETQDIFLNKITIRGASASGVTAAEVTIRVYDSAEVGSPLQIRPTGPSLGEFVLPIPAGMTEAEHILNINHLISVPSSITPVVVAHSSGAASFNIANTAATWTEIPRAARSTDGLTGATWGNAGDKQHVMFVDYSFLGPALTSPLTSSLTRPLTSNLTG